MFFERMVLLHQSFGTPRVIYALQEELGRHNIDTQMRVSRRKKIASYQLWVYQREEKKAREVMEAFKCKLINA